MGRDRRFMNRADQLVGKFRGHLEQQYGFVVDETKPLWENICTALGTLSSFDFDSRPSNMACHNHLEINALPSGTSDLLGLGLNYCITSRTIETTDSTFTRLREDCRRIYALVNKPPNEGDDDYIPSLYIKSDYKFDSAHPDIEDAIDGFEAALRAAQRQHHRRHRVSPNLTAGQWELLRYLRRHDDLIVVEADKNLGPCILDRIVYIRRGCSEHLGNAQNYQILSKAEALTKTRGCLYEYDAWLSKYRAAWEMATANKLPYDGPTPISKAEATFLRRARKRTRSELQLARFRMTMKVHKTPWKMRPIVCCAGTFMNEWSRWLDYQLQRCKPFVPTYLRDGQQVLDEVSTLDLPSNAILFTADANSMYNNIDTNHACEVIGSWLDELAPQIGADFPVDAIKTAMNVIMRNNIFEWGDLYFLQLLGTAMGTSAAVMWATLYFGYHEVHTLLPRFGRHLLYFRRFIDDMIGVWLSDDSSAWIDFQAAVNNFGILTWEFDAPGRSVNFLDMTLSIRNGKIESRTYQKPMNLYLYLPSASAHTRGTIKGTIYGLMSRYHAQNTHRADYLHFVTLLYQRLLARGWQRDEIYSIFLDAAERIEARRNATTSPSDRNRLEKTIFVHLQYHPFDISRSDVRRLFDEHCADPFKEHLDVERPIVAYSRPRNIGEYVTQARLHQPPGQSSSVIMGEYKSGLDPP